MTATLHAPDELLLGFARALRAAGVGVTHDRATAYLEAVALLGAGRRETVRRAGRATLCHGPDDLERHDRVFDAWFTAHPEPTPAPRRAAPPRPVRSPLPLDDGGAGEREQPDDDDADVVRAAASDLEVLAHRDVAAMSASEKALLDALIGALRPRLPQRRATRRTPWRRGELDVHRTLRDSLRRMGEPAEVRWRRRATVPRRVVLLVDVSGSMTPYADALLRLAHRLSHAGPAGRVETFTLGTRLTRVTEPLRTADAERALVRAGEQVPDWSGGTRLGETLGAFLDRWGALARGAVVVVLSDGWERGDADELGRQMARLGRLARRVVWANPHRGKAGYAPVQQGIAAALPHCDDFVAGHSLRSFTDLLAVVARA